MKNLIFALLIVFVVSFGLNISANAQLEDRKNCGKNEDDECFHTSLTMAARRGDTDKVKELLRVGTPVDEKNYFKRTALKEAIIRQHRQIIGILIETGADVNDKEYGWTPLGMAMVNGNEEIFKDLIIAKADYTARFDNGKTLLIAAAGLGRSGIIEILLFLGEDINAKDNWGMNALMCAILNSFPPSFITINYLITRGIDINASDNAGLTALAHARTELKRQQNKKAEEIYSKIIKILEEAGAIE